MPIMTKTGKHRISSTVIPHPRFSSHSSILIEVLLAFICCVASASAQLSVQYVTSIKGYPTSGNLLVTVYGSGFGSTSTALSVSIGSTVCAQPAIVQQHTRISCKLGKFSLLALISCRILIGWYSSGAYGSGPATALIVSVIAGTSSAMTGAFKYG
jgi:hypothetical protein